MAIGTDAGIWFFGTQDPVDSGTGTVADDAYGDSGADWTNDDDATDASAVIKLQFDGTPPTVGNILLFAQLKNIQSTNDEQAVDVNFEAHLVGVFVVDYGVAADTDYYITIPNFQVPQAGASQVIRFWIKNNGTTQTVGTGWNLWITPKSIGPHA